VIDTIFIIDPVAALAAVPDIRAFSFSPRLSHHDRGRRTLVLDTYPSEKMEEHEAQDEGNGTDPVLIDSDGTLRFTDARGVYWTRYMTTLRPPRVVYWFHSENDEERRLELPGVDDHDLSVEELRAQLALAVGSSTPDI
jgi:hypothetical protein